MSILGHVEDTGDSMVTLRVRVRGGSSLDMRFQVDTGFNGAIGLSSQAIQALNLTEVGRSSYVMADGSKTRTATYDVDIEWLGAWRRVLAVGTGGGSLLGMQALYGHRLVVDAIPGGRLEITPLPAAPSESR
jgi:clan AA aspartic protease